MMWGMSYSRCCTMGETKIVKLWTRNKRHVNTTMKYFVGWLDTDLDRTSEVLELTHYVHSLKFNITNSDPVVSLFIMYRSIRNFNIPPPPGISREFDFKSSPGSREFDVLSLPCGGAFDNGVGHLITEWGVWTGSLKILPVFACFLHAQKRLHIGGKYSFLRFRGKRPQFCEKLAQRNGHGKATCFIWRYVLQNCVKLLNFQ